MTFDEIVEAIKVERDRQDRKWGVGFNGRDDSFWLSILVEEVGEVANAIIEFEEHHTEVELIQVAAVVFSWLQYRTPYGDQPASHIVRGELGVRLD